MAVFAIGFIIRRSSVAALMLAGARGGIAVAGGLIVAMLVWTPVGLLVLWIITQPLREVRDQERRGSRLPSS